MKATIQSFGGLIIGVTFCFISVINPLFGQNVSINTTGDAPTTNSMLEVKQPSATTNTFGLYVEHTGANAANTHYAFQALANGAGLYKIAAYLSATGGTNNYALIIPSTGGNVGIGTTTPEFLLTLGAGSATAVFGVDNAKSFAAKNSTGTYEQWMWPRWSDNIMYMNYGSAGFNIRNNSSTSTMFMNNAGNVGIGTSTPGAKLEVAGQVKITGGTPGAGKVLTSDAAGLATWQTQSSSGWSLTGNASTVDGTNFIGTTDDIPVNFRVNNQKAGRISKSAGDGSTFLGYQAGNSDDFSNNQNTAIGFRSLFSNTTGSQNTANGSQSLHNNTTGSYNAAYGYQSLYSNVAGSNATAIGYRAMLYANNTATAFTNYNVALGFEALLGSTTAANNTGNYNTALGYQTLFSNTSGNNNIANGYQSLYFNTTGTKNTANGNYSLYSNTTGTDNVANGYQALFANTIGLQNTANGNYSLYSNTTGFYNTANGNQSLYSNTTGDKNTANGCQSLSSNTMGAENTANGHEALFSNTFGSRNTANGFQSLSSNTTGSNNTALGYNANVSAGDLTNATAIGNGATVNASNKVQIGDGAVTAVQLGTGSTVTLETGLIKLTGGTPGAGKVLTSDAAGLASWQTASLPNGTAAGNTPYWNGTNWITNSSNIFNNGGNVGIGTSSPATKLDLGTATSNKPVFRMNPGTATAVDYSGYAHNDFFIGSYSAGAYPQHYITFGHTADGNRKFHIGSGSNAAFDGTTVFSPAMTVTSGGFVGIGTTSPGAKLEVNGQIKITGGTPGAGKVLTSDAAGLASWQSAGGCGLSIGDTYQGGIIFYLDASGCHGLISAPADQSTGVQWQILNDGGALGGGFFYTHNTSFASCGGCGDGNTSMIVYNKGAGTYAAKICYDLSLGGYSDWYLPSKYELNLMYLNIGQGNALGLGNVGGFASNYYWSSTEDLDKNNAWRQDFDNGPQINANKGTTLYVRAVRAF